MCSVTNGPRQQRDRASKESNTFFGTCQTFIARIKIYKTRPSALGMSDPVMEFLEIIEKGINWAKGTKGTMGKIGCKGTK